MSKASMEENVWRTNSSQLEDDRNTSVEQTDTASTEDEDETVIQELLMEQTESGKEHNEDIELAGKNDDTTLQNKIDSIAKSMTTKDVKSEDDSDVKPSHSYIALIAMAILSCANKKMILGDIYQYIADNYPYYRNKDKSWRNSIRHNLSLNECFIKAGRSENGKGNYWAIHPANLEDFSNGDFRRRRARRRVRKSNALKFSNGMSGLHYLRGYTPLAAAYSAYPPYKSDDYSRMYSAGSGYSSYLSPAGNRNNFAIDSIMSPPTNYKQYYPYPSLMYDQASIVSPYPLSLSSANTATASCSPVAAVITDRAAFSGPYSSSLSALASLSHGHRGNESWQDTLCKLQENLKKPSPI